MSFIDDVLALANLTDEEMEKAKEQIEEYCKAVQEHLASVGVFTPILVDPENDKPN
jgi:Trm5-related predicted tRNA methylase